MRGDVFGGGGGKSGGGGGGISEAPDTLASVALVRFIDLIGEGPIAGLVNGEYSIYMNGVPLKDISGTPNYKPFRWDFRTGTQAQTVMPNFATTQSETAVGLKLLKSSGRIVRSIADSGAEAVRVTVSVRALSETNAQGQVNGSSVSYIVWVRIAGGTWQKGYEGSITGKTTSTYQRSHEIPLGNLGAGPYEVGVERITNDSVSALIVNDLWWDNYTTINYEQYSYPNSSIVGVELDARYFNDIPERSYHLKGLLVKVPTNYDPVGRFYATTGPGTTNGAWDGTFKTAYTNNPAWCFYDLATNPRYGCGSRIGTSVPDKWTLYEIGQYCDQRVPTGLNTTEHQVRHQAGGYATAGGKLSSPVPVLVTGYEPRFTLNVVINTQEDAYRVLNQLATAFRGMVYWASGSLMFTQDSPRDPSFLFTNANVEGGIFNYEGSARSQRHTTVLVGWNDPTENFKQKWEYIEDREGIERYGVRSTEIVAFGCTSRTQARRFGLWLLYTERMESEAISFKAGMEAATLLPGEVGQVMDTHYAGARWGGRVVSATTTSITIDAPAVVGAGTYTLTTIQPDGTLLERSITLTAGSHTVLTFGTALPVAPQAMSVWSLASTAVTTRTVRLVSVKQSDATSFEVTCLEHNPTKFAAIESGAALSEPNYSFITLSPPAAPTTLRLTENSYRLTAATPVTSNLEVSWDQMQDPTVRGFVVKHTISNVVRVLPEQRESHLQLSNVSVGTHTISVQAVNHLGVFGPATTASLAVTGVDAIPPSDVSQASMAYTIDRSNGILISWDKVDDYIDYYEIRNGSSWGASTLVARAKTTVYTVGLLSSSQTYLVKAVDTSGNYSVNAASVTIPAQIPTAPTFSYVISGADELISWTTPTSTLVIDRYELRYGTDWASGTFITTIKATSLRRRVDFLGSRTYWVAAIDIAGNVGDAARLDVTITGPGVVTSARSEVVDNNVLLYWGPPATGSMTIERYEVRKGTTWDAGSVVGSNGNSTFTAIFEQASGTYIYWIRAYDSAGNANTPVSISATVSQPPDYVLRDNRDSTFTGTKTNVITEDGALLGPVNTTETWTDHFNSRGWASPQAQIDAGYPLYLSPSVTSGSYSEDFYYGSVAMPPTVVTITIGSTILRGSVTMTPQIYHSLDGASWTALTAGVTSALIPSFKYVRVVLNLAAAAGDNLIKITSLNVKLAVKLKTDSGTFTITDANAGVTVPFNVSFVDADTPIAQPNGTTPLIPVVSFSDVQSPTGFTVFLHARDTGAKVTGSGSWTARGY